MWGRKETPNSDVTYERANRASRTVCDWGHRKQGVCLELKMQMCWSHKRQSASQLSRSFYKNLTKPIRTEHPPSPGRINSSSVFTNCGVLNLTLNSGRVSCCSISSGLTRPSHWFKVEMRRWVQTCQMWDQDEGFFYPLNHKVALDEDKCCTGTLTVTCKCVGNPACLFLGFSLSVDEWTSARSQTVPARLNVKLPSKMKQKGVHVIFLSALRSNAVFDWEPSTLHTTNCAFALISFCFLEPRPVTQPRM